MFIDFKAIKGLASLETVAYWLGLNPKGGRCTCPVNDGDKRELVLTFDKGLWRCFGCGKKHPNRKNGGDQIALVQHVLDYTEDAKGYQQAATHIRQRFQPAYTKRGLPEEGLDYLDFEHEMVKEIGLSKERAEEIGIGFAPRGTLRNHLLFPMRDKAGKLMGYIGYTPDGILRLPKSML